MSKLKTGFKAMKEVFIDTETTGLDPSKNGIIQLSGIIVIDNVIQENFDFRMNPVGAVIEEEALKITKKTVDEICSYPHQKDVYTDFLFLLDTYIDKYDKSDKAFFLGYNPNFDFQFLLNWFSENGNKYFPAYFYSPIDVKSLCYNIPKFRQLPNHRLETVCKAFDIELKAHDSMNDIRATYALYKKVTVL